MDETRRTFNQRYYYLLTSREGIGERKREIHEYEEDFV